MADNESLFPDALLGTCECCESDEKPVVTFADEFGTTLCEGCYLACVGQVSYGRD